MVHTAWSEVFWACVYARPPTTRTKVTELSARQLGRMVTRLKNLPVAYNHDRSRIVGQVVDSNIKPDGMTNVGFRIRLDTDEGIKTYQEIKSGKLKCVSLAHEVHDMENEDAVNPVEVSVCEQGMREQSWIINASSPSGINGPAQTVHTVSGPILSLNKMADQLGLAFFNQMVSTLAQQNPGLFNQLLGNNQQPSFQQAPAPSLAPGAVPGAPPPAQAQTTPVQPPAAAPAAPSPAVLTQAPPSAPSSEAIPMNVDPTGPQASSTGHGTKRPREEESSAAVEDKLKPLMERQKQLESMLIEEQITSFFRRFGRSVENENFAQQVRNMPPENARLMLQTMASVKKQRTSGGQAAAAAAAPTTGNGKAEESTKPVPQAPDTTTQFMTNLLSMMQASQNKAPVAQPPPVSSPILVQSSTNPAPNNNDPMSQLSNQTAALMNQMPDRFRAAAMMFIPKSHAYNPFSAPK